MKLLNPESNVDSRRRLLSYLYLALFSLSVAFFSVSLMFLFAPFRGLRTSFIHLEVRLNLLLGIRQTDLIRGYFEYAVPSAIVALGICGVLASLRTNRAVVVFLQSIAPFVLVFSPPLYWISYYNIVGWPFGWPFRWAPFEILAGVVCIVLFQRQILPIRGWTGLLLIGIHVGYWYMVPSTNPSRADYSGPFVPVLTFFSLLAWGAYSNSYTVKLRSTSDTFL